MTKRITRRTRARATIAAVLVGLGVLGGAASAQANNVVDPYGQYGYVDRTDTIWVKGPSGMINGSGYRVRIAPAPGVSGGTASVTTWSPDKVSKSLPGLPEDRKYIMYVEYKGWLSSTFHVQKTITFYT